MPIERDGTLTFTGRFITEFVAACSTLKEARQSLPDLTAEQYTAIKERRARLDGDSKVGLTFVVRGQAG